MLHRRGEADGANRRKSFFFNFISTYFPPKKFKSGLKNLKRINFRNGMGWFTRGGNLFKMKKTTIFAIGRCWLVCLVGPLLSLKFHTENTEVESFRYCSVLVGQAGR